MLRVKKKANMKLSIFVKKGKRFFAAALFCGSISPAFALPMQFATEYLYYANGSATAVFTQQNAGMAFVAHAANASASASYLHNDFLHTATATAETSVSGPSNAKATVVGSHTTASSFVAQQLTLFNLTGQSQTYRVDYHAPGVTSQIQLATTSTNAQAGWQFGIQDGTSTPFLHKGAALSFSDGFQAFSSFGMTELTDYVLDNNTLQIFESNGFFLTTIGAGSSKHFTEYFQIDVGSFQIPSVNSETVEDAWLGPLMRVTQLVSQPATEVPEPTTLLLMGAGLLAIAASRRNRDASGGKNSTAA